MKIALCVAVCLTVFLFAQGTSAGVVDNARKEAEKILGDAKKLLKDVSGNLNSHAKKTLDKLKSRLNDLNSHISSWFNDNPPSFIASIHDTIKKMLDNIRSYI